MSCIQGRIYTEKCKALEKNKTEEIFSVTLVLSHKCINNNIKTISLTLSCLFTSGLFQKHEHLIRFLLQNVANKLATQISYALSPDMATVNYSLVVFISQIGNHPSPEFRVQDRIHEIRNQ